jgi:hypothetical protein
MPHHGFSGAGISKPPPDLGTFGIKIAGHAVEDLPGVARTGGGQQGERGPAGEDPRRRAPAGHC